MKFALVFDNTAIREISFRAGWQFDAWDKMGITRPIIISAYNEELWDVFEDYEVPPGYCLAVWDIDEEEEIAEIRDIFHHQNVDNYKEPGLMEECLKLK